MNLEDTLKHSKNTQVKGHCIYKEATKFSYLYKAYSRCFFFFFQTICERMK